MAVETTAGRPRSASSEGGSLSTLFYPPLPEDHQIRDATGSAQTPVQSAALLASEKLRKIRAAGMDAESAEACSTPTAIKAHRGSQIDFREGCSAESGAAPRAAMDVLHGYNSPWNSPARRRPHGDSSGSLASTPPPRGPIRFPSHKEGRLSYNRTAAL
jgi:hypothetical protein